jgi:hypothetical protein
VEKGGKETIEYGAAQHNGSSSRNNGNRSIEKRIGCECAETIECAEIWATKSWQIEGKGGLSRCWC